MFTPDPTNLVAEYLFEEPLPDGTVRNTASPGNLDGYIQQGRFPLEADSDVPTNFQGSSSLNYNVLREAGSESKVTKNDAQYVRIKNFPDPPANELTLEAWVKVDYFPPDTFPNGKVGFGACPQPICKTCAYYLFLGTLQTDRNLIFTHIPGVLAGIPKPDTVLGPEQTTCPPDGPPPPEDVNACPGVQRESGVGGIMSQEKVLDGVWIHIAATFTDTKRGAKPYLLKLYINCEESRVVTRHDNPCGGSPLRYEERTNNKIHKPGKTAMHLGMFRQILDDLDYQYSGKMCGVRVYHRALSREEIKRDFEADIGCSEPVGSLIQGSFGNVGNFEFVGKEGRRLRHYWRSNDNPKRPWNRGPEFGSNVRSAPALLQSSFGDVGNFEILTREGDALSHYWRSNDDPKQPWSKSSLVGKNVSSAPAFIQSTFGDRGNFEVVVREGDKLRHYWRSNDQNGLPWNRGALFGDNVRSAPALIQSTFGDRGTFEVVVREGSRLRHYWRSNDRPNLPWNQGPLFGRDVDSAPAFIQGSFGGNGNFEVVVKEGERLRHYWRNNADGSFPWNRGPLFGDNVRSAPTLIQSTFGNNGNFEIVVREGDGFRHYWRNNDDPTLPWKNGKFF